MVTSHGTIELLEKIVFHYNRSLSCFELHVAYNCKLWSRNGFHAPKLVRNNISHLIIGLVVYFFKYPLAAILNFCRFLAKATKYSWEFFGERYMTIWGYREKFSALTPKFPPQTAIFHKLTAAILNFQ